MRCASVLMISLTPASRAIAAWRSFRSRRSGVALILEHHAVVARRGDDLAHLDGVGLAPVDPPAGRMRQDVRGGVLDRPNDAARLSVLRQLESRVHGDHHHIQLRQRVVVQVQRSVVEDVDFRGLQNRQRREMLLQRFNGPELAAKAFRRHAAGDAQRLRVVRNRDVVIAARLGGDRHLLERVPAVAGGGVHLQIATDVVHRHQRRQPSFQRGLDFAAVFTQLRRGSTAGRGRRTPLSRRARQSPRRRGTRRTRSASVRV